MRSRNKGVARGFLVLGLVTILGLVVVPRLPQFMMAVGMTGQATGGTVQQLQVGQPRFDDIDIENGLVFEFTIPVENPNPFPAKVDRITYSAEIDGEEVAEGSIPKGEMIPAGGKEELTDRVQADLTESLSAGGSYVWDSIRNKETYLVVSGQVHVSAGPATFSIPFQTKRAIN